VYYCTFFVFFQEKLDPLAFFRKNRPAILYINMPRGKKKKAVVARSKVGKNIVAHLYINNFRQNTDKIKALRKYDPKTRQHVEILIKDEKHSS